MFRIGRPSISLIWVIFCAIVCLGFLFGFGYFVREAFRIWFYPPGWRMSLMNSTDPEIRALTHGDVAILFMMSCAPLGFALIWGARLWMAISGWRENRRINNSHEERKGQFFGYR